MSLHLIPWIIVASIAFGLAAMLFSRTTHFWAKVICKNNRISTLASVCGRTCFGYRHLPDGHHAIHRSGDPSIVDSFSNASQSYDFLLKILFTGFTLGAGFKGGEVTPAFLRWRHLGKRLVACHSFAHRAFGGNGIWWPFFGEPPTRPSLVPSWEWNFLALKSGLFIGIACLVAYFSSGSIGIYHSQIVKRSQIPLVPTLQEKRFGGFLVLLKVC